MKTIVVTRHAALVQYLIEKGIITKEQAIETIAEATEEMVEGNIVIGVLPIHLIAKADVFVNVAIHAPLELRGQELTLEQVRQYAQPVSYFVAVQCNSLHTALQFKRTGKAIRTQYE